MSSGEQILSSFYPPEHWSQDVAARLRESCQRAGGAWGEIRRRVRLGGWREAGRRSLVDAPLSAPSVDERRPR